MMVVAIDEDHLSLRMLERLGRSDSPEAPSNDGNPWDVNLAEQRSKAEALMDQQHPMLLIGSPMCTAFSNIQNLNKAKRDPAIVKDEYESLRASAVVLPPVPEADRSRRILLP